MRVDIQPCLDELEELAITQLNLLGLGVMDQLIYYRRVIIASPDNQFCSVMSLAN